MPAGWQVLVEPVYDEFGCTWVEHAFGQKGLLRLRNIGSLVVLLGAKANNRFMCCVCVFVYSVVWFVLGGKRNNNMVQTGALAVRCFIFIMELILIKGSFTHVSFGCNN